MVVTSGLELNGAKLSNLHVRVITKVECAFGATNNELSKLFDAEICPAPDDLGWRGVTLDGPATLTVHRLGWQFDPKYHQAC
jgi:hypothetical protein